jgi:hypothetical protein
MSLGYCGREDMAGEADFTPDEWTILQRAMMAAGVIVSLAAGGVDDDEMFALMQGLRGARFGDPNQLVRELAGIPSFATGLKRGMKFADYEGPGLEAIRSATATIAMKAPADLPAFRVFLVDLGEQVANANKEGGFAGLGAQWQTAAETAAIDSVKRALGMQ